MADLIIRRAYTPMGTFGVMTLPNGTQLHTIEDPADRNRTGKSCIPEGEYPCVPRRFNKGGYDAVHVTDVPGRSLILFHVANTTIDVRGCIGVGTGLGFYRGRWSVTNSRGGFQEFMRHFGRGARPRGFTLRIEAFRPRVISDGDAEFQSVLASLGVTREASGEPVILPGDQTARIA